MKDTISINYTGFHPSEWTQTYLEEKLQHLQEIAPYGAVMFAHFARKGKIFRAHIHVNSSAGKFFAKSSGSKLKEVSHHLIDQIFHQIGKWKDNRFDRESIRHMDASVSLNHISENNFDPADQTSA